MERTYFLTTARAGFSRWSPDDRPLAHLLWGDPQVTRYLCKSGRFTPEEVDARLELELKNGQALGLQYWPLFTLGEGEFIGCCGLRSEGEALNLGFQLRPAFWGQGYGPECAQAVIKYAFDTLGIKRLIAGHHPDNSRSQRALAKLGFRPTGPELYPPTGLMHPGYILLAEK